MNILVIIPLFNDWESVELMLADLDEVFKESSVILSVLIVDDGSTVESGAFMKDAYFKRIQRLDVLRIKINVGHQRALAIGLAFASEKATCDLVIIMDSDGEDQPSDVLRLVERAKESNNLAIVFAQRVRRSESLSFQLGYFGFKALHYVLTGRGVDIGNFSAIPSQMLPSLVLNPSLWNHYAATVVRSRHTYIKIPTVRGQRIKGKSHLNYVSLIMHGLHALWCYSDIIGVRSVIICSAFLMTSIVLAMFLGLAQVFFHLIVPMWMWFLVVTLFAIVLQLLALVSIFTIQSISVRATQPFIPVRDYTWFIGVAKTVFIQNGF